MKRETLAGKLAQKAFESAAIQRSWKTHTSVFGPILDPAFIDNYQARLNLTAALNYISNRELEKGLEKLQSVNKMCSTEEDKAAWLFCMGLYSEMAYKKEDMIAYYQEAAKYGHCFYLPYLKIAKTAHTDAVFATAKENYIKAIQCINEDDPDKQERAILGSAYTNLASCLTMMHCYDEAEEALKKSAEVLPEQKGRAAAEAILEAVKGNSEKAYYYIDILAAQSSVFYESTKSMVNTILADKHPQFSRVEIDDNSIKAFWNWFTENEGYLLKKLEMKDYDTVIQMMQLKLKEVFAFMERDLKIEIEPEEGFYQITFADYYMTGLEYGYEQLIEAMPKSLTTYWRFNRER